MNINPKLLHRFLIRLTSIILLVNFCASAQQDTTNTYSGISLSEISIKASQVTLRLLKTEDLIKQQTKLDEITNSLPQLLEEIEKEMQSAAMHNLSLLRGNDLLLLEKVWNGFYQQLSFWQNDLKSRVDLLNERSTDINHIINNWRLTYKNASDQNAPSEIKNSINEVIRSAKKVRKKIERKTNELLIFQNKIANSIYTVTEKTILISAQKDNFLKRTFSNKTIPIWEVWAGESDSTLADIETLKELSYDFKASLNYLTNIDYVTLQLLVWILFAAIVASVKRNSSKWEISSKNTNLNTAVALVQKPIPTSFILAFMSIIFFAPHLPYGFAELNIIILAIPAMFLLKLFIRKRLLKYFLILFTVYILTTLSSYLFIQLKFERHLTLLFDLVSIISLLLIIKNQNEFIAKGNQSSKVIKAFYMLGVFFFSAAIITNFTGRYDFAKLLSSGMISGIYYAVMIRLFTYLLDSIIALIFRDRENYLLRSIKKNSKVIEKRIISLVHIYFTWVWVRSFLNAFTIYESIKNYIINEITYQYEIGSITISISEVLLFFAVLFASWYFAKIIRIFLEDDVFSRFKFPRGVPGAISMVIKYILVTFGFFLAVASAGIDITTLGVIAGGLGVGLGFGLQNVVFNLVSGLILTFERPIQTGDTVEVGNLLGSVTEIGVRSSKVRTFDGSEVIVPNGNLISNEVINWSLSDRNKRINLPFITAFGSDPNKVTEIIIEVLNSNIKVLKTPAPMALFEGYNEHGLLFKILFWVNLSDSLSCKSEVAMGIHDSLSREGIELPIPKRDINLNNSDN